MFLNMLAVSSMSFSPKYQIVEPGSPSVDTIIGSADDKSTGSQLIVARAGYKHIVNIRINTKQFSSKISINSSVNNKSFFSTNLYQDYYNLLCCQSSFCKSTANC